MIDTRPAASTHRSSRRRVAPVGRPGCRVDVDEHPAWAVSGFLALLGALAMLGVTVPGR